MQRLTRTDLILTGTGLRYRASSVRLRGLEVTRLTGWCVSIIFDRPYCYVSFCVAAHGPAHGGFARCAQDRATPPTSSRLRFWASRKLDEMTRLFLFCNLHNIFS